MKKGHLSKEWKIMLSNDINLIKKTNKKEKHIANK